MKARKEKTVEEEVEVWRGGGRQGEISCEAMGCREKRAGG